MWLVGGRREQQSAGNGRGDQGRTDRCMYGTSLCLHVSANAHMLTCTHALGKASGWGPVWKEGKRVKMVTGRELSNSQVPSTRMSKFRRRAERWHYKCCWPCHVPVATKASPRATHELSIFCPLKSVKCRSFYTIACRLLDWHWLLVQSGHSNW